MATRLSTLAKFLLQLAKWLAIFAVVDALPHVHSRFGPALVGLVAPLLTGEAWLSGGRNWRVRLCHNLGFAIPAAMLRLAPWLLPTTQGYESAGVKALAVGESLGEYSQSVAIASSAALVALLLAFRAVASRRERRAYVVACVSAMTALASVTALVVFIDNVLLSLRY